MNPIENIKLIINEYKDFRNSTKSNFLISADSKKRNLFQYFQAKSIQRKYRTSLYEHFGIMDSLDDYDFLIQYFGKNNLEKVLNTPNAKTEEIGEKLLRLSDIGESTNYILRQIEVSTVFNKATGLNLSEFMGMGINPKTFSRKSLGISMIDIFKRDGVTKDILKEIYDTYGEKIISSYNDDSYLRNRTILELGEKYKESAAVDGLQDHVTYYSEDNFKTIFEKYFSNEELTKTEKFILIGLLTKESDLIGTYTIKHLREHPEYIKSEIDIGIFDDIVISGKKYTNEERKEFANLSKVWNKDDLNRYNNLALLKERLKGLPQEKNAIDIIDKILSKPLNEIAMQGTKISELMDSIYMDYEVENRIQLVDKMYEPGDNEEIIITDLSQMESPAMLHFFRPDRMMSNFDLYIKELEEKRSKELGKPISFTEEEKKSMKLQYENKENHYITDYALDFEGIGQVGTWDTRYVTNTSNQLCTMVVTPNDIFKGEGTRGNIALGFSRKTLKPELIATTSSRNIHSNKGIDYVESKNPFNDFSVSYNELLSKRRYGDNNEIVLFRNSYENSLKPSYVMYIGNIDKDKKEIDIVKKI